MTDAQRRRLAVRGQILRRPVSDSMTSSVSAAASLRSSRPLVTSGMTRPVLWPLLLIGQPTVQHRREQVWPEVVVQPRPARFKVHGCSRGRHDHRLGRTQLRTRRITLWSEQVARAVDGNWDRTELPDVDDRVYARALGRVLAHELGHLLLRLNGHRDRGLMRSVFSHRSLITRGRGAFRLAEEDLQAIRDTLARGRQK